MSVKPPSRPPMDFVAPRNCTRPGGIHLSAIDAGQCWLATVRRHPIIIPLSVALTQTLAPVSDKFEVRIRIPPFCLRVQWIALLQGQGNVYVQASAAPAAETWNATIRTDTLKTTIVESDPYTATPLTLFPPTADGDFRPLEITSAVPAAWDSQDLEIWIVNDPAATKPVTLWALVFYPVPRMSSDADLL